MAHAGTVIRVLLVDDVSDLRTLFRHVLDGDEEISVVGEAGDGLEAITQAERLRPDVIVLDLAMPRLDGLRAIPRLHEVAPGTRILVLSAFSSPHLAARAIESCATAMIEKGIPSPQLTEAIHDVFRAPAKSGCAPQPA